jgi:hypothetical protein
LHIILAVDADPQVSVPFEVGAPWLLLHRDSQWLCRSMACLRDLDGVKNWLKKALGFLRIGGRCPRTAADPQEIDALKNLIRAGGWK